ncbi:MAG: alpha/beta hydrolase [Burkholderiales bacterium]
MRALLAFTLVLFLSGCTQAFFQPHRHIVGTPGLYGVEYHPVEFKAEDGTGLFAWFLPARGKPRGSVLYLHGNAENISTHFANVAWMPAAGFNVLALDYRGYGGSQGSPTLEGVQLDIDAAMRTLLARPGVDPSRIIIFGQSLGGALAIHYAAHSEYRANVRAIVIDSAFSDYRRIVRDKAASFFLTWPFQWLLPQTVDNNFSPAASVHAVSPIPLLFIHGERDSVVPVEHSKRLYARAAEPKEIWVVPDAGHIQAVRKKDVRKRLAEFLQRHSGGETGLALR